MVGGRPPGDPADRKIALYDWQLEIGLPGPEKDLASAAELAELAEDKPDRRNDMLVRIELNLPSIAPALAGRQSEAQLAALGLGVASGETALARGAELVYVSGVCGLRFGSGRDL